MTKRDDEDLAHTATAASGDVRETTPLDTPTLGRYRLERKLGEGGMGVVHAAFDPDLERRVALKVLRVEDRSGSTEARQRLLREARAMARLTHPNVVVVHEVGNAHGRDYVAMELIDGDSVSDWLRGAKRDPEEILAVFLAAGRGLAAAHAANLVHRDFKPHNILRGHDGRVVVTDFGLARGVDTLPAIKPDAFETTIAAHDAANAANTPSSLSGLTLTGSVLGTPAYMAPEQWNAETVGPAADQFAFCVALWEALVGERPYRGDSVEQLKAAVERGPESLDASRVPRPFRKAVQRGLDPDPRKRWPSMDALLARLGRKRRSRLAIALVVAGTALAAFGIAMSVTRPSATVVPPLCPPAARDVATVWSQSVRQRLAGRGDLVAVIDANTKAWSAARTGACVAHQIEKLACLDGSLARTDAIIRATAKVSGKVSDQLASFARRTVGVYGYHAAAFDRRAERGHGRGADVLRGLASGRHGRRRSERGGTRREIGDRSVRACVRPAGRRSDHDRRATRQGRDARCDHCRRRVPAMTGCVPTRSSPSFSTKPRARPSGRVGSPHCRRRAWR